jgi:LPS O-antigen subunit length determinant protein (WzzB/FepE family)
MMDETDIFDIKDNIPIEQTDWTLIIAISLVVIILLIILAVYIAHKKSKKKYVQPLTPTQKAIRELNKLNLTIETSEDEEYSVNISSILRTFIEKEFNLPAPEKTTDEFFELASQHPVLKNQRAKELKNFLYLCDQVKFARHTLTLNSKQELHHAAMNFVTRENKTLETIDK